MAIYISNLVQLYSQMICFYSFLSFMTYLQFAFMSVSDNTQNVETTFQEMKALSQQPSLRSYKSRKAALQRLVQGYEAMKPAFAEALKGDLGYGEFMSNLASYQGTLNEIKHQITHLKQWMEPKMVPNPLILGISSSTVEYEPLGLVLVISAWNYPFYTALGPAAAAIAAGNSVIIKPSEFAPYCSNAMKRLFDDFMDPRYYRVIEGQVEVGKKLSTLPFDLICFTGSTATGRSIAIEAAKNLTPCLLELGGKCPSIVDQTASINNAALKICFGKFLNSGQTCVAADHVYVQESVLPAFRTRMLQVMKEAYGKLNDAVREGDYTRIVTRNHIDRLQSYLNEAHGGKVIFGGQIDKDKLIFGPTLVENPTMASKLMTDEIFGPILPIIPYKDIKEVIAEIRSRPKPLAIYLFSENKQNLKAIKRNTSSGAIVMNEAVLQMFNNDLPFGGVGKSGYGRYHGSSGFISFSNPKSICQTVALNVYPLNTRFPPYTPHKKRVLSFLLRIGAITYSQLGKGLVTILAIGAAAFGIHNVRASL